MAWFWLVRRHVAEAVGWFERVLAADGGPTIARASALVQSGFVGSLVRQDDLEGCLRLIREGQEHFVELGDEQGVNTALTYEAVILWFQRDLEGSTRKFVAIQTTLRDEGALLYGFEGGDAFCGFFLNSAAWFMGDMTPAYEHYTRSLEIFRRLGDFAMIAWTLVRLANVSLEASELDKATAFYNECLPMMADLGDRHGAGAVLLGLGMAAHFRGETVEAQLLLTEAQTNLREGGGGQGLSWPISNVLVDTRTHDLLVEATNRYQSSLDLPAGEWARMVCSDGEAWRARVRLDS